MSCFFPCLRLVYLYAAFACLHDSSNHGARCLAHRFGFRFIFLVLLYTTPAVFASDMRNSSILSVYRSLFSLYYCVMWSNAATNVSVEVCAFQSIALFLYSATHSPLIHWCYVIFYDYYSVCSSGGVECGDGEGWCMEVGGWTECWRSVVGWGVGGGVSGWLCIEVIGRYVNMRLWSDS